MFKFAYIWKIPMFAFHPLNVSPAHWSQIPCMCQHLWSIRFIMNPTFNSNLIKKIR